MEETKKLIIFESNAERAKTLESWLKELNLDFVIENDLYNLETTLSKEKFTCLLLSLHPDLGTDSYSSVELVVQNALSLVRALKKSPLMQDITAILVTSQKAAELITSAVNAGIDNVLTEEANKDQFLDGLKELLKRIRPASEKKRLVNLNLINKLIQIFGNASREDFFLLTSTILNQLLIDKLESVVGEPTLRAIIGRLKDTFRQDYPYLQQIEYLGGGTYIPKNRRQRLKDYRDSEAQLCLQGLCLCLYASGVHFDFGCPN